MEVRPQPPSRRLQVPATSPDRPYFADFVCESGKLIVELDGPAHEGREDYDERRTQALELFGYAVLRFPNERVLADPGGVLDDILAALRSGRL